MKQLGEINIFETMINPIHSIFHNINIQSPETNIKEINIKDIRANNIESTQNGLYNKQHETPEMSQRNINQTHQNFNLHDKFGTGYISNVKNAFTTIKETVVGSYTGNPIDKEKSLTINTIDIKDTQRQHDSNSYQVGIANSQIEHKMNSFDKSSVNISDCKNIIESEVSNREPTQKGVDIIPSKSLIQNVILRDDNHMNIHLNVSSRVLKNHQDINC